MVGNKGIRKSQNITRVNMVRGMRWHARIYTHKRKQTNFYKTNTCRNTKSTQTLARGDWSADSLSKCRTQQPKIGRSELTMPSRKWQKAVQTDRERVVVAESSTQTGDTTQQATSTIRTKNLTRDGCTHNSFPHKIS